MLCKSTRNSQLITSIGGCWLLLCLGCVPNTRVSSVSAAPTPVEIATRVVSAQGKLLPAEGIIQVSGVPGDRIESILVDVGDRVEKGDILVHLRSEQARNGELKIARARLNEVQASLEAKRMESDLNLAAAQNRLKQAESQRSQAKEQREIVEAQVDRSPDGQVGALQKQLEVLVALRNDPLTRPMIGSLELASKKTELSKLESMLQSNLLTARQAEQAAALAVEIAQAGIESAKEARRLVDVGSPTQSLEAQIALLEAQVADAPIKAPCKATILSRMSEAGEICSGMPILELANLESMICLAEIHEGDIQRIEIGDTATLTSSGLTPPIMGVVQRIDMLAGSPQLRSPNPMARTDFRALPVVIQIVPEDVARAAHRVQLQVDVMIEP